jgi:branched-chain amino acid transport system permease protein
MGRRSTFSRESGGKRVEHFLEYTINGLTAGSFYALMALGYTIVYGIIRLINFAHGDLTMVGAFVGWTVLVVFGFNKLPLALGVTLTVIISIAVTSGLSVAVLRLAYRPLLRRSPLALLIAALAISLLLQNGVLLSFGANIHAYPGLGETPAFEIGNVQVSFLQVLIFVVSFGLMLALYAFVQYTAVGTAMRALAVDHEAARLMGIDVDRVITIAFVLGAILAAVAGVMIGFYYTQITFFIGFQLGLRAFTAAVLGGIGNIPGAMAGGLLIGLLEAYCAGFISSGWRDVFVFGVLILVLVVKPTGLLGERVAERM